MSATLTFIYGADTATHSGDPTGLHLHLQNPHVAGDVQEAYTLPAGKPGKYDGFATWESDQGDMIFGVATTPTSDATIERDTQQLYLTLLARVRGHHLHRIWHFVPDINKPCGDIDRYMLFCAGRAAALCDSKDSLAPAELPPASAVGTSGEHLAIAFVAGKEKINPAENPLQVPAYRYPRRYGPRSPSFARAGTLRDPHSLYVSGTASIRNSESLHAGDAVAQFETAMENIAVVARHSGFDLQAAKHTRARLYVKTPEVWQPGFAEHDILRNAEFLSVVQADICRSELLIEVELYASS